MTEDQAFTKEDLIYSKNNFCPNCKAPLAYIKSDKHMPWECSNRILGLFQVNVKACNRP